MKYLCMIFADERAGAHLTDKDQEQLIQEHLAYDQALMAAGRYVIAEALQPNQAVTTVKVRGSAVTVTDGPFIETKDQLTGFYLISAHDLNEAIQIVTKIPSARYGNVEIRPIRQLEQESQ